MEVSRSVVKQRRADVAGGGVGHLRLQPIEPHTTLKQMARSALRGNPLTLNPTSLVHDAFLKLMPETEVARFQMTECGLEKPAIEQFFADRSHFFKCAARAMRQIVVDQARGKSADKRGWNWIRVELTDSLTLADDRIDVLTVDAALRRLQARDAELAEITEAYFEFLDAALPKPHQFDQSVIARAEQLRAMV